MDEVEVLGVPLSFGRAHADVTLSEDGNLATKSVYTGGYRTAASTAVMRSGRHFAQFTVVQGDHTMFGVIRPGWDVEGTDNPLIQSTSVIHVDGHCLYSTRNGRRYPGGHSWEDMQPAEGQGYVSMLLDLDQGSMTVYTTADDGVRRGVMQAEGLSGPLCWAATLGGGSTSSPRWRPLRRRRKSWRGRRRGRRNTPLVEMRPTTNSLLFFQSKNHDNCWRFRVNQS